MKIKPFLYLVATALFVACNSDNNESFNVVHPRYSFSEVAINKSYEGSASGKDAGFTYENELLTECITKDYINATKGYTYTSTQSSNSGSAAITYSATTYSMSYTLNSLGLVEVATRVDYAASTVAHQYLFTYSLIGDYYYVSKITHQIKSTESNSGSEYTTYYVLSFDYSNFNSDKIVLTQTLFDVEQFRATLTVDRNNEDGVPDYQLIEFHPLDKLIEGMYGGLMGTFNYCIAGLTVGDEVRTADVQLNSRGNPALITISSSNTKAKTTYYTYTYTL